MRHRVAEALSMTETQVRHDMAYEEFIRWCAYLKIKDERVSKWEWYAAQVCLVLAQVHSVKRSRTLRIADFILSRARPKKPRDGLLKALVATFGGTIKKEADNGDAR